MLENEKEIIKHFLFLFTNIFDLIKLFIQKYFKKYYVNI